MSKSFKTLPKTLSLSLAGLITTFAHAQTTPITNMQTVTIMAQPSHFRSKSQTENVYAENSIAMQQADHLSRFLSQVPGVNVGGTSGMDQRIYIRGQSDERLKVTVDGARQENDFFYHAGRLALDTSLLKAAQIAVGNNSVTLGNNATGGAVAFSTVDATDFLKDEQTFGARLKQEYHSNDKQLHTLGTVYGQPNEQMDFLFSYGHRNTDGGKDGLGRHIQGDSIKVNNILAKFNYMPSQEHKLTASFIRYDNRGNYPLRPEYPYHESMKSPGIVAGFTKKNEYTLGYQYQPSDSFNLKLNAFLSDRKFKLNTINSKGGTYGFNVQASNLFGKTTPNQDMQHKLVYGGEIYRKHTNNQGNKQHADSFSVYAEDQIRFGRFQLTPGLRYDFYKPSSTTSAKNFKQLSGALAGSVDVNNNFNVFASYTQFFNGPPLPSSIFNKSARNLLVAPNPNLKPETGANTELGFTTKQNGLWQANDQFSFTGKIFNTKYKDTIEFERRIHRNCQTLAIEKEDKNQQQCTIYHNLGDNKVTGFELVGRYQLDKLGLKASYSRSRSKLQHPTGIINLRDDSGTFNLGLDYDIGNGATVGANYKRVAANTRNELAQGNRKTYFYPSYQVLDVYGSYVPSQLPALKLDLGIYNVANKAYFSHASKTDPVRGSDYEMGRNVKISASYQF